MGSPTMNKLSTKSHSTQALAPGKNRETKMKRSLAGLFSQRLRHYTPKHPIEPFNAARSNLPKPIQTCLNLLK